MSYVPGERGHGPVLWVNNRVLDYVRMAGHLLGQELFCPARGSVRFGQQAPGEEAVVRRHLAENDVLRQNMIARVAARNR